MKRTFCIACVLAISISIVISCNKKHDVISQKEQEIEFGYLNNLQHSLGVKMDTKDYTSIDFKTATRTKFKNGPDIVRVGFAGKSIENDFVLLEVDTSGNILRGKIIHLNCTYTPDERTNTVIVYGNLLRSSLDRKIEERFKITKGRMTKNNPVAMEDEMLSEVVVYAELSKGIGFSAWYGLCAIGGFGNGNGGYWSSTPGTGGSGSVSGISDEDVYYDIIVDTSIRNNTDVYCVYQKVIQKLAAEVLKPFSDSKDFDLQFKTMTIPFIYNNDGTRERQLGRTSRNADGTFIIEVNVYDIKNISKIELAETFIHEAFHAQLRQHAIEVIGTEKINEWPKKIDDMTLTELSDYYYQFAKGNGSWDNVGHTWMVNHIEACAGYLKNYVQRYYPEIYTSSKGDINVFIASFYRGLGNALFLNEEMVKRNISKNDIRNAVALLNTTKCP